MLEKFNNKYSDLNHKQKYILKEFIESVDSSPHLKEFYNTEVKFIQTKLTEEIKEFNSSNIIFFKMVIIFTLYPSIR